MVPDEQDQRGGAVDVRGGEEAEVRAGRAGGDGGAIYKMCICFTSPLSMNQSRTDVLGSPHGFKPTPAAPYAATHRTSVTTFAIYAHPCLAASSGEGSTGREGGSTRRKYEGEGSVASLQYANQVFFSKIPGWTVAHPVTQLPPPMALGEHRSDAIASNHMTLRTMQVNRERAVSSS
jgi:hypothetical protein